MLNVETYFKCLTTEWTWRMELAIIGFLTDMADCMMTGKFFRDINIIINDYRKIYLEHFKIIPGNQIQMFLYQFKCKSKWCQRCKTNWRACNRNDSEMLLPKLLLTINRKRRRMTSEFFKASWQISLCHWIKKHEINMYICKRLFYFYYCTVHYGIYILFTHQQIHFY